VGVDRLRLPGYSGVQLRMLDEPSGAIRTFTPESISDGTLRASAILAALFQPDSLVGYITLVSIDEPELGLHPSTGGALFDALTEAAEHVQVIVATQGDDLLDRDEFDLDWARVVVMDSGTTVIGPVDAASREIVAKGLATAGELMRGNQFVSVTNRFDVTTARGTSVS
jgi:predicted ATPase